MHLLTQASGRRKVRRALGTAATTAVLVSVLGGGSALAATQDGGPATVSGPASYPPSGVTDQGGRSCAQSSRRSSTRDRTEATTRR